MYPVNGHSKRLCVDRPRALLPVPRARIPPPPRNSNIPPSLQILPKRASLMGLPTELRLRIYEFLFTGTPPPIEDTQPKCIVNRITSPELKVNSRLPHCCTLPNHLFCALAVGYFEADQRDESVSCTCMPIIWGGQVLSVNKQIFAEAMPILYGELEVRIFLPEYNAPKHARGNLSHIEAFLPSYASEHIKKAVVVSSTHLVAAQVTKRDRDVGNHLKNFWPKVWGLLPKLREIKFHFDVNAEVCLCPGVFAFEQFLGLVHGEKLKELRVEVGACKYDQVTLVPEEKEDRLRNKMVEELKEEVKALGSEVEVVDVIQERKDRMAALVKAMSEEMAEVHVSAADNQRLHSG